MEIKKKSCGLFLGTKGKIGRLDGNADSFDTLNKNLWQRCTNCGTYLFVRTCTDEEVRGMNLV